MFHRTRARLSSLLSRGVVKQKRARGDRASSAAHGRLTFEPLETRLVLNGDSLLISEFMAVNGNTLQDSDNDFPDWIEIYNPTAGQISLDGWYLTDTTSDLTKWAFPDRPIDPGQYLTVFASDKDRVGPGDELHTNFKLSGNGEYLALVDANGPTIVHEFSPEFPRQLQDVSYGLPDATTLRDTLIESGATARYRIPTVGEDPTAWTAEGFNDSAWTDSFTVDPAGILITEIGTGDVRMVEIQNVFDGAIDLTGWKLLVNDAAAGINAVNSVAWSLPGEIGPGDVQYRTDNAADQYWGSSIDWDLEGSGWAMIVDASGSVMDFVGWGYSAAEIAAMSVDFGAFTNVAVGDQWSGAGAESGTDAPAGNGSPSFVAFNDHMRGGGTHTNTTEYTPLNVATGLLKDIGTGDDTSVTLTTSQSGVNWEGTQGSPAAGTDAYNIFNGYVDFSGTSGSDSSIALSDADELVHEFSGLDEGDLVTYNFAGSVVRGRDGYTNRWTLVTLQGADSAVTAYSSGIGVVSTSDTQVAIWSGENHNAGQGFVAAWTEIDPGADGEFSIISRQYTGDTPGVGSGVADGSKGYGLSGIRLEEVAPSGPTAWLRRAGNFDTDMADDFVRVTQMSQGELNPDMTVPFGAVLPVTTGIGFSDGQPEFDANIRTHIGRVMQNVNASVWVRIPFDVVDPAVYDEMTLRMKFDDGFVAYLNGVEVTRRVAPDPLQYDSQAEEDRDNAQAVVFEDFGLSGDLDRLHMGTNVLAIHGLNVDAADGDFLLLPELIAAGTLDGPQYMINPTPGAENDPDSMGAVSDTKFSVDRGFYDAPFDVEISTKTSGADIRYTTDGSEPTATYGTQYTGPITIDTTTTLRSVAYRPGYIPTNVDTHTYLFLDDVLQQPEIPPGYPNNWGHSGANYGMDPEIVNDVPLTDNDGQPFDVKDALLDVPSLSLVMDQDDWFGSGQGIYLSGQGIERGVSAEMMYPGGKEGFQINAMVQIQGGTSTNRWKVDKLSMRVKFKEPYGPTKLDFPLYDDSPRDSFDSFLVDAMMNLNWLHPSSGQQEMAQYIRDQYVSDIQNEMGGYGTHGFLAHLYLNGLYWGLHWIHERPDETFASDYFGGEKDDYDVVKHSSSNIVNGTNANYLQMFTVANAGLSSAAQYATIQEYLDVPNFIDYMITNFYVGNTDWAHHNWYASRNRVDPAGRWRFHSWDAEHVLKGNTDNETDTNNDRAPTRLHIKLRANAEYRILFADHLHRYFFNDGLLMPGSAAELYEERLDEIDRAVVGESARWGDNRRSNPYTRDDWLSESARLLGSYFPQRSGTVLTQLRNDNLYPSTTAPTFSQHGGEVSPGYNLTMNRHNLTVYYTLDGNDPRLPGGATSPTALIYTSGTIPINDFTHVKARAKNGSTWSALNEAEFFVMPNASPDNLMVSEINYHPYDPTPEELLVNTALLEQDFEFVELRNTSGGPIDLHHVRLTGGVEFDFAESNILSLAAGEHVVIAANSAAYQLRYPSAPTPAGEYAGQLDNGGERLMLLDISGESIFDFYYNDSGNWPGRADGKGAALEWIDTGTLPEIGLARTQYLQDSSTWRSSTEYGGSPGSVGLGPITDIVVNEVLTHTDLPDSDSIELHNTTSGEINIGGWFLSDSWGWDTTGEGGNYKKFRIPNNTRIPGGGYIVFDENDFNPTLGTSPTDFALSGARGDDVWLMAATTSGQLTRFVDHVEFPAAANGETLGRWPNATGDLYPMDSATLGSENLGPRVGPVIISEVMYNPADPGDGSDPDDFEYIELYNGSSTAINLANWRTRKGIDFDFSASTTIQAGGVLVVVPFNVSDTSKMTAFRDRYGLSQSVAIVGGYKGVLNNGGERVQLQRPDQPTQEDPTYIPRLIEDEVIYDDMAPWPTEPDGGGPALHRRTAELWGNDPVSWEVAAATPGLVSFGPLTTVTGHYVFYNNSAFDDGTPSPSPLDDAAIATDKTALLPGQTASFANYTSFPQGINGILIDVVALKSPGAITAADFEFRTGNSNSPDSWSPGPAPADVSVRTGLLGANRISLSWAPGTITNEWLQVTVLANGNTGLLAEDVFYFGNAVGEAGDSLSHALVNATDEIFARNNQHGPFEPAGVDDAYDYNRDRLVNATDQIIARSSQTSPFNSLRLIHVPTAGTVAPAPPVATSLVDSREPGLFLEQLAWQVQVEQAGRSTMSDAPKTLAVSAVDRLLASYW